MLAETNQRAGLIAAEVVNWDEATDDDLMRGLRDGQIEALEALYARYSRPVFSLAFRILNDTSDAEEVTQDVFERVWRHSHSFDVERGRFGTWLLSMAHHVSIDVIRRHQRRPQTIYVEESAAGGGNVGMTGRDDVSDTSMQNVEAEQVRRMLRSLPREQRQAIELAYYGGLSHLEIAALLGDPLGTVKTRIRRGMERLRTALEGIGLGNDDTTEGTR